MNKNSNKLTFIVVGIIVLIIFGIIGFINIPFFGVGQNEEESIADVVDEAGSSITDQIDSADTDVINNDEIGRSGAGDSSQFNPDLEEPASDVIVISGSNYEYSPASFTVQSGEEVTIRFDNENGTHDLVFEGLGVGTQVISGGQSETITFTAPEPGSYNYYCSVGNHRTLGMEGVMSVE